MDTYFQAAESSSSSSSGESPSYTADKSVKNIHIFIKKITIMANRGFFNAMSYVATPLNPISRLPMPSYERQPRSQEVENTTSADERDHHGDVSDQSESHLDEEAEAAGDAGILSDDQQPPTRPTFELSMMMASIVQDQQCCQECGSSNTSDFYSQLKSLKHQNIAHLEDIEGQIHGHHVGLGGSSLGRKYARSEGGGGQGQQDEKRPLFVLDMPCCCSKITEESEESNAAEDLSSIEEDIGIFDGVTDTSEDDDLVVPAVDLRRSRSKRSIRVQSAPLIFGERPKSAHVFKPTVIQPFKMTQRYNHVFMQVPD
jgi:hypothetical protein